MFRTLFAIFIGIIIQILIYYYIKDVPFFAILISFIIALNLTKGREVMICMAIAFAVCCFLVYMSIESELILNEKHLYNHIIYENIKNLGFALIFGFIYRWRRSK